MSSERAANDVTEPVLVLHRLTAGEYRFDADGVGYRVIRQTDGTLGSAVIWDVVRESDRVLVRSFITLSDLRRRWFETKRAVLEGFHFGATPENAAAWWRRDLGVHQHSPNRTLSMAHAACDPLRAEDRNDDEGHGHRIQ